MDIFSPYTFKGLTLQNRIMRSATAECMADDLTGIPRAQYYAHYQDLADGQVGLIITGHLYVDRAGKCHHEMTAIDRDEMIPHLKQLTDLIHLSNSIIIPQINFGGLQCSKAVNPLNLSPSHYPDHGESVAPNREITSDELEALIIKYALAAKRAQIAGFDGVMLHGAHGYFISQTLSPSVNQRKDKWGGNFDKRLSFLSETIQAIRTVVGADFPILIKLGIMDGIPGGLALEDGLRILSQIASMGIDAVEISGGFKYNAMAVVKTTEQEAYFRSWAQKARKATNLPLFLVGGFRSLEVMNAVLADGEADLVSMCRPLICEPDLILKLKNGQKQKADCISCNRCFPQHMNVGTQCRWKADHQAKTE